MSRQLPDKPGPIQMFFAGGFVSAAPFAIFNAPMWVQLTAALVGGAGVAAYVVITERKL